MTPITPYLMFDGRCREAMTFYQQSLGGRLETMRYADAPPQADAPPPSGDAAERLMHACLSEGDFTLMASDCPPGGSVVLGDGVQLMLRCDDAAALDRTYDVLAAEGEATQRPRNEFWGDRFGMLRDRFGVWWLLTSPVAQEATSASA